jgi:hypothetical protein
MSSTENELHLWRSRAIDSFALAEAAIEKMLRNAGGCGKTETMRDRINRVLQSPGSALTLTDDEKGKVDRILGELIDLLPLRNAMVHAPMLLLDGGETSACFANPQQKSAYCGMTFQVTKAQFQRITTKVKQLAKDLETT